MRSSRVMCLIVCAAFSAVIMAAHGIAGMPRALRNLVESGMSWPGLTRPSRGQKARFFNVALDGRVKPDHDSGEGVNLNVKGSSALTENNLKTVRLSPTSGAAPPLDAVFNEALTGKRTTLREAMGGTPAVLLFVDYSCRFICGSVLGIATAGLDDSGLIPGQDFHLIVIGLRPMGSSSGDTRQAIYTTTAQIAPNSRLARATTFLQASPAALSQIEAALNYRAAYDASTDQFAHPTGAVILTSSGRVSDALLGLDLSGPRFRTSVIDAGKNGFARAVEGVRLLCFSGSAVHGVYGESIRISLMLGAAATLIALAAFLVWLGLRGGNVRR